jgi:hypothetical protein
MQNPKNKSLDSIINELERRLVRYKEKHQSLYLDHSGNEPRYTYWAGYDMGEIKGFIKEIENTIDNLNELKQHANNNS